MIAGGVARPERAVYPDRGHGGRVRHRGLPPGRPCQRPGGRKPMMALANVPAAAGTILIFTGQRGLFVPGFFLDAAAGRASSP